MRRNTAIAMLVLFLATGVFAFVLIRALWVSPQGDVTSSQSPAIVLASTSVPVELVIPALDIRAKVQQVGVTAQGNMGIPTNFADVGWYKYGVVPGQPGSAVMDGHIDNALALPGVFKRLPEIEKGDSVYVKDADGRMSHFIVYDVEVYPYDNVPMKTVFASTTTANLNLITCEGMWVKSAKTYDKRVVVYTRLAI